MLSLPASAVGDPLQPETAAIHSAVKHVRSAIRIIIHSNAGNAETRPVKYATTRSRAVLSTVRTLNGAHDSLRYYMCYISFIYYLSYVFLAPAR